MKLHIRFNSNGEFGTVEDENFKTYCGRWANGHDVSHAKSVSTAGSAESARLCSTCIKNRDKSREESR